MNFGTAFKFFLRTQIILYKRLQKSVAVNTPYKVSGVIMSGYIGRVFGKNIADYLVYGVIALFLKRVVDKRKNISYFLLGLVAYRKGHSSVIHN